MSGSAPLDRAVTGRCLCGAVAITVSAMYPEVDICHCAMCQRWGGAFYAGVKGEAADVAGEEAILAAVQAKKTAVDACDWVVDRAVQLHGGMGYMRESEVERHYRDARVLGIGGGATEVMDDLAARLLGY